MEKLSRRNFSEILGRAILQNPESVFNKIAAINSRLATLLKRSFHQGAFPVNTLEF